MKNLKNIMTIKKAIFGALFLIAMTPMTALAGHTSVRIGIGINYGIAPRGYYAGSYYTSPYISYAPVYTSYAPVYSAPVYVAPRPVYVAPRPVYVAPPVVYPSYSYSYANPYAYPYSYPSVVVSRPVVVAAPAYYYGYSYAPSFSLSLGYRGYSGGYRGHR